jgi:hypothetical protein
MGGRLPPEWVAGMDRNEWPAWAGARMSLFVSNVVMVPLLAF